MSDLPAPPPAFPADPWHLLRNRRAMTAAIADVTGAAPEDVRRRLWREFLFRGGTVRRALREEGGRPYVFDDAMVRVYGSDAFLYELAIWNQNLLKRSMRASVARWITRHLGPRQRVLTWGDGLGFDALKLSEAGHRVTSFELPGDGTAFAGRMLAAAGADVEQVTEDDALPEGAFDAILCLDVLEHVPDVEATLARIRACLRPGGVLIVHAPFYFVHRASVTHLRTNRRYAGSLALFRRSGFALVDANPTWAPLVFARSDGPRPRRPWLAWPRLALALPFGLVLVLGRWIFVPSEVINVVTRLAQPWFVDDMLGRGEGPTAAAGDPGDSAT